MNLIEFKEKYDTRRDTISITRETIEKITHIMSDARLISMKSHFHDFNAKLNEGKETVDVVIKTFLEILDYLNEEIEQELSYSERNGIKIYSSDKDFDELSLPFYNKLKGCYDKLKSVVDIYSRTDDKFGTNENDLKVIIDVINTFYDLKVSRIEYYKFRDLLLNKSLIIDSLKTFCDELVINTIENDYNNALSNNDVEKMQETLEFGQLIIKRHWKSSLTDPKDYKNGEEFRFICHSMRPGLDFKGNEFASKYISCSLLSDREMGTYKAGFGFIFDAENIVAASSEDLYVDNFDNSDSIKMQGHVLANIKAPEEIIKECETLKRENPDSKIYNEVDLNEFNPKAIFCLTDGSKTLCDNYNNAYILQESFPDLQVIEIDQLKYTNSPDYMDAKKRLIFSLLSHKGENIVIDNDYINRHDLFFKKFEELKERGNYTEDEIFELYKRNEDLLFFINNDKLLEIYDDDEIETILKYNYFLKISDVLSGDEYGFSSLEEIYNNLSKYSNSLILDKYVQGLSEFLRIIPYISLNENEKLEICKYHNFIDINNYMKKKINLNVYSTNINNEYLEEENVFYR